jgi:hypothetical protein
MPSHMRKHLRSSIAALGTGALIWVASPSLAEEDRMKLERCSLEMVDCATGPKRSCLVGPSQLDEACMERCRREYDACMAADRARPSPRPRTSPRF